MSLHQDELALQVPVEGEEEQSCIRRPAGQGAVDVGVSATQDAHALSINRVRQGHVRVTVDQPRP